MTPDNLEHDSIEDGNAPQARATEPPEHRPKRAELSAALAATREAEERARAAAACAERYGVPAERPSVDLGDDWLDLDNPALWTELR